MTTPRIALTAAALAALPGALSADVVVYAGSGELSAVDNGTGSFAFGQAFSFEITVDTDQASPDQDGSPNTGLYSWPSGYDFRIVVPDASFDSTIEGNNMTVFYNAGSSFIDQVSFSANGLATLTLRDETGGALPNDGIPLSLPDIDTFEIATLTYFPPGSPQNFTGTITEVSATLVSSCAADLAPPGNPDGVLNFFDISEFIGLFSAGDPAADFVPDSVLNFFDVAEYLVQFQAGCP